MADIIPTGTSEDVGVPTDPSDPVPIVPPGRPGRTWPPSTKTGDTSVPPDAGQGAGQRVGRNRAGFPVLVEQPADAAAQTSSIPRPTIRPRGTFNSLVETSLDPIMAETIPGYALEFVAEEVYGNANLWFQIADANQVRHPAEWTIRDRLRVPPTLALRSSADTIQGLRRRPQIPGS